MAERRVPRIRFKGFEEDWEQRKLGEMAVISTGYPFNSNEFSPEGKYLVITNGNIQDSFTNVDESVGNRITLLDRKILDSYILDIGDILITMDGTVGRTAKVAGNGLILAQRVGRVKPIGNTEFMYQALSTGDFSKAMTELSHGGTIKHISLNEISLFEFKSPVREREQNTVGKLLYLFDTLLSLHQRKLEKLKILKKAMLEKMFPKNGEKVPEIRFSGFADDWEQRKLGEIAEKVSEKNFGMQYSLTLTNSAEFGVIAQRDFFDHDIAKASSLNGYYVVHNEDFVYNPRISVSAPVGPINRNKLGETGVMSPLYTVFRPHDINATYLEYFFKSGYWHKFMNFNGDSGARADRFSIKDQVFFEMPIPFPNPIEQRKIGNYLKRLDSLLSLHQRKLEKLRQIKKSMLERMFV